MSPLTLPTYNLKSRKDTLTAVIDLGRSDQPIVDVLAFDPPDDVRGPARLELVAQGAMVAGVEIGWRLNTALVAERSLGPGERAILSVSRDWLAARVVLARAEGAASGDGTTVALRFVTIFETPRGPVASPVRTARITVLAGASQPSFSLTGSDIDLDDMASRSDAKLCDVAIDVPPDLAFAAHRSLLLDIGSAHLPPEALRVALPPDLTGAVTLVRAGAAPTGGARFRLSFPLPSETAGQRIHLPVLLGRDTLVDQLDALLANGGPSPRLVLTARLTGWGEESAGGNDRRFSLGSAPAICRLVSRQALDALLSVGTATVSCAVAAGEPVHQVMEPLAVSWDPEAPSDPVRFGGLAIAVLRWPVVQPATLVVSLRCHAGSTVLGEETIALKPELDPAFPGTRRAKVLAPLRGIIAAAGRHRHSMGAGDKPARLTATIAIGMQVLATLEGELRFERREKRWPLCIDLGASAISLWAGSFGASDAAFDMKPLALGAMLNGHLRDGMPRPDQGDDERMLLLQSEIGVDSRFHLRAQHLPASLPSLPMLTCDRAGASTRMAAFGRRYDVSVPAMPDAGQRGSSAMSARQRVAGLKSALAAGTSAIALPEPINMKDSVTGDTRATTVLQTPELVADVLDELVDLYGLRLSPDTAHMTVEEPPTVIPRVVVTCPSGVGDEISRRYDAALALFRNRLERLFPGVSAVPDAVQTITESVAAARYIAEQIAPEIGDTDGAPHYLLALDIGASTSDAAVAAIAVKNGRLASFRAVSSFGLPIGGARIDEALARIVATMTDKLLAQPDARHELLAEGGTLARSLASGAAEHATVQQYLLAAIERAKATLSQELRAADGYHWEEDRPLRVVLMQQWPDGDIEGVIRPRTRLEHGREHAIAPGVKLCEQLQADGTAQIMLCLSPSALQESNLHPQEQDGGLLAQIADVLGRVLPRMARAAIPPSVARPIIHVVTTGRGALWPPLHAALRAEAQEARDRFPFDVPLVPATMKKAVAGGAALLLSEPGSTLGRPAQSAPLALAVKGVHLTEQADGSMRAGQVTERALYLAYGVDGGGREYAATSPSNPSLAGRADLGQRFVFSLTVPGLDPQGRILAKLRGVLGHQEPVISLEGDALVDAQAERVERFGVCSVISEPVAARVLRVTIRSQETGWEGMWQIEGEHVTRIG